MIMKTRRLVSTARDPLQLNYPLSARMSTMATTDSHNIAPLTLNQRLRCQEAAKAVGTKHQLDKLAFHLILSRHIHILNKMVSFDCSIMKLYLMCNFFYFDIAFKTFYRKPAVYDNNRIISPLNFYC